MPCDEHAAKRERARELRRAGWSRAQISRELGVRNSGTLTYWLKDIPAPQWTRRPRAKDEHRERAIALRLEGRSYRDIKARRVAATERVRRDAAAMIGRVTNRELFLAGIVAYWAEGSKAKPWNVSARVSFANSDPSMIRLFLAWLAEIGVPRCDVQLRLAIHERADLVMAQQFWADATGFPLAQFSRATLKKHNPRTPRRNVGPRYGGCLTISVRKSTDLNRRISGWYEGIVRSVPWGVGQFGRPPGLGPGNARSSRAAPAVSQSTLFEPTVPCRCRVGT